MADLKKNSKSKKAVNLETLGLEMGNKPPQALDFEEAVLGAMLIEPNCVEDAIDELDSSCFYDPKHRMIFEAMYSLVNEHESLDLLSVKQRLEAQGNLETIGGAVRLAALSQKIGAAANIEYYLKVLKQKRIQRDLITASFDILKKAYDDTINMDLLIDSAQSEIYKAIREGDKKDVQDIASVVRMAMDEIEEMQGRTGYSGVPSGYPSLDDITMGWQKSDLIILAARPSVGKTAFALNVARNAAVDAKVPVAIFSLEMPAIQLVKRLMVSETELPSDKLKGGSDLTREDWEILESKTAALTKAPIYIDDTPSLPIMEFRTKVKRLVKTKKVGLVIVDYLQLMQGPPELRGMREQEVAAISRTLKATAKELNIPIIALSQLSRQATSRERGNGKPMLSDLRESGSIEQDADMVLFVHRPDYIGMSENKEDYAKTFIIIAKHRNGQVGEIEMRFKSEIVKFVEKDDNLLDGDFSAYSGATTYNSAINDDMGGGGVQYDPFDNMGGGFGNNSFQ